MAPITAAAPRSTRLAVWLLALMAALPFLLPVGADPIPSFEAEVLAVTLGLTAVVSVALRRGVPQIGVPGVVVLPLGVAAVIVGQLLTGDVAQERLAVLAVLVLLWAVVMMCLGATLRRSAGTNMGVPVLAGAVLVGALINVVVATVQAVALPDGLTGWVLPTGGGRPGGNLGQPNHLAAHVAFGAVSLGYLWLTDRWRTWLAGPVALVLAWGWAITGSRTAWLACAVIVLLAWGIAPRLGPLDARRARLGARFLAVALVAATAMLSWFPRGDDPFTSGARAAESTASLTERLAIWEGAGRLFLAAPVTGQGHGAFASSFFEMAPRLPGPPPGMMTAHAHNLPLHVAAEYGLAGLLVLAVGGLVWWRGVSRGRWSVEILWAVAIAGIGAAHSLVEYPLWFAYFLGPVSVALGLAEGPRLECGLRRVGRLGWAAVAGVGVIVLVPLMSDYAFLRSLGVSRVPERSVAGDRLTVRRIESLQKHSLLAGYADVGLHRALDFAPLRLPAKVAFSALVVRATPLPDVAYRHALLLSAHGEGEAARWWWSRATASYPGEAEAWRRRARAAHVGVPSGT